MTRLVFPVSLGALAAAVACLGLSGVAQGAARAAEVLVGKDTSMASRDLAWTGGDRLSISIPADVQFTQGPTSAVHVTGPRNLLDHVVLRDGKLMYDRDMSHVDRPAVPMHVTMTAPDVKHFAIIGYKIMTIDGYRQDAFDAAIVGAGRLAVHGAAGRTDLKIVGAANIDAGGLSTKATNVLIVGAGGATVAPRERLEGRIFGSGDILLKTNPASVDVHNLGSGRVIPASF